MDKDKYVAYVQETLNSLALAERRMFCNGVGSKLSVLKYVKPPLDICNLFASASDFHDMAYWLGGRAIHKAIADAEFYERCLVKCYSNNKPWYARLRLRVWAMLCLVAVRLGGGPSFNFCKEPLTKERLFYLYEQLSSESD